VCCRPRVRFRVFLGGRRKVTDHGTLRITDLGKTGKTGERLLQGGICGICVHFRSPSRGPKAWKVPFPL
jgi:hypothetical protein